MSSEIEKAIAMFGAIIERAANRFAPQPKAPNVLPRADVDFAPYFTTIIPKDCQAPEGVKRGNLKNQAVLLRAKYRGRPEILALHMLLISYLRRDTPWTNHAKKLFFRLWNEHQMELLEILPPREIISALRTIADYADSHNERLAAKMGVVYASLIKGYETERIADGHKPDEVNLSVPGKGPRLGIDGMGVVGFGRDDSLEIIHLMMAEEVQKNPLSGPILMMLMKQVREGECLFNRIDNARIRADHNLHKEGGWSFGFHPHSLAPADPVMG